MKLLPFFTLHQGRGSIREAHLPRRIHRGPGWDVNQIAWYSHTVSNHVCDAKGRRAGGVASLVQT